MSDHPNNKTSLSSRLQGKIEVLRSAKNTLKDAMALAEKRPTKSTDQTPAKENPLSGILGICVIVALIWGGCKLFGSEEKTPIENTRKELTRKELTHEERIENPFSAWDGSQPQVVKWIKQNIKDPDSYKHIETKFIDKTEKIGVITTFTATNSFGGRVKTTCIAYIDTLGILLSAELTE
ncbi:MAG: hypothetical protein ABWZ25_11550 [Chitinophagaceae bacterium]